MKPRRIGIVYCWRAKIWTMWVGLVWPGGLESDCEVRVLPSAETVMEPVAVGRLGPSRTILYCVAPALVTFTVPTFFPLASVTSEGVPLGVAENLRETNWMSLTGTE